MNRNVKLWQRRKTMNHHKEELVCVDQWPGHSVPDGSAAENFNIQKKKNPPYSYPLVCGCRDDQWRTLVSCCSVFFFFLFFFFPSIHWQKFTTAESDEEPSVSCVPLALNTINGRSFIHKSALCEPSTASAGRCHTGSDQSHRRGHVTTRAKMSPFPPGGSHRTAVGNECLDYWFLMHLASNRKQLHYLTNCAPTLNIVSRITRRAAVLFITCGGVDLISQIKTECANLTVGVSPWLSIWVRKWQELGVKCDWNT